MASRRNKNKLHHAAHIKGNTVGTSNEISFSVLDAAKMSMDGDANQPSDDVKGFGRITIFTLPHLGKTKATPTKERGITLPSGTFVSTEGETPEFSLPVGTSNAAGDAAADVSRQTATSGNTFTAATQPAAATPAVSVAGAASAGAVASAVPAAPRISAQDEIARRKAKRRTRRIAGIVVGVLVVAALVVAGVFAYKSYSIKHRSASEQINIALQKVQEADTVLVKMDQILANPIDAGALDGVDAIPGELTKASKSLKEARSLMQSLLDNPQGTTDEATVNNTITAIDARLTMIDTGGQLLSEAQKAVKATDLVQTAWSEVLVADSLARDAASLVSAEATSEHLLASREKTSAALGELERAGQKIAEAVALWPEADLSLYVQYVEARTNALRHSVASDEALIGEDATLAIDENDAYTAADAQAATIAAQLSGNPADAVVAAYKQKVGDLVTEYEGARTQAGTTDAFLRNYLGTSVK